MARYLGLDVGATTIGLASSEGIIVSPRATIRFSNGDYQGAVAKLKVILEQESPELLVFGYPLHMDGSVSRQAVAIDQFINLLLDKHPKLNKNQIVKVDERRTTIMAQDIMKQAQMSWNKRQQKKDSLAAQLILEQYLEMQKRKHTNHGH